MDSRIINKMEDDGMNIKLVLLMAERKMGNTELSRKTGVSRSTIQRLRAGKAAHYDNMKKLAEALGVEVTELI